MPLKNYYRDKDLGDNKGILFNHIANLYSIGSL